MRTSVGNTGVRAWVGLLVVALHLIVLVLIFSTARNRPVTATDSRALTLVEVERAQPARAQKEAVSEPNIKAPTPSDPSSVNIPSIDESAATTDPETIPDWQRSMDAAATAAVGKAIKEESYRALGPRERNSAGSAAPPSIFETPKHKAGDIEHDATQGRTLIWHNEHCFTELRFPTIKDATALIGAPNPPKCMRPIGERKARGDLFESIKTP